jgi:hypothetical protein
MKCIIYGQLILVIDTQSQPILVQAQYIPNGFMWLYKIVTCQYLISLRDITAVFYCLNIREH